MRRKKEATDEELKPMVKGKIVIVGMSDVGFSFRNVRCSKEAHDIEVTGTAVANIISNLSEK